MKLLDLFCCEGGASVGYARAGFDVYGVDLFRHRGPDGKLRGYRRERYPFKAKQGDALDIMRRLLEGEPLDFTDAKHENPEWWTLDYFDVIAASPPCQRYSITNASRRHDYPDLIGPTRDALIATGKPYVIENVAGAPLLNPVTLCWSHFYEPGSVEDDDGTPLRMERHRLFETNFPVMVAECFHPKNVQVAGSYGGARRDKIEARTVRKGGYVPSKAVQERLLGIDWMTQHGLFQSVPPVYTEHIGGFIA